jgi:monovalent cation:H+ antiporter-2, CPA2 family
MPHDTPLIATIVVGLCLAFVFGTIAQRIRVSPLVGYLLAGVLLGPYTPGFVADQSLASELAEIGVILLMFGVGLHFSLKDLWSVRSLAVPGAIGQIAVATAFGMGLAHFIGWSVGAGLVFGLALSVASTVVLLRALQERRLINTERGRIAVGWLIVEDLVMVLTLVLLPAVVPLLDGSLEHATSFGMQDILETLALTIAKVAAFIAIMLVVGRRVIPWVLHYVAHGGSRELFRLAVLSIALGCAYGAAQLFGVSFALGAFFAGMILSESALSQQAAAETLPLRDAFAVLFFISVGMLFDPTILVRDPLLVLATVAIIIIAKSVAALLIVRMFGRPFGTAATIAASLAQIGEFSFILAGLGVSLGLMPPLGRELILAGAIITILLNPMLFLALDRLKPWLDVRDGVTALPVPAQKPAVASAPVASKPADDDLEATIQQGHTVLVGYGNIGRWIGEALSSARVPIFVIEEKDAVVDKLKASGIEAVAGSAPSALEAANLGQARALLVAIPEAFEAGQIVAQARAANASLFIIVHAHSDAETAYLTNLGADVVVEGAREIADTMVARLASAPGTATYGAA